MKKPNGNHVINFEKLRELMRNPDIAPLEKCIVVDLLLYAGIDGEAFPSELQLGKDFGYSDRHIRTVLASLKKRGWLNGWRRRGYSQSNKYIINAELYFRNDSSLRKPTSAHSGTVLPVQSGTPLPPKVSHESNQLSSSHIQQLFEKTSNTKSTPTDHRRLHELCEKYSASLVEDAIKEISTRRYPVVKVGLITKILGDWEKDGKPLPKPEFNPCNIGGCTNGYKFKANCAIKCQCLLDYEKVEL